MKRTIMLILILNVALSLVHAQIPKGKFLVGVSSTNRLLINNGSDLFSVGFSTLKEVDDNPSEAKTSVMNIMPKAGYFIADNLVMGADLCLISMKEKYGQSATYSTVVYAIGPFVRYYFSGQKIIPVLEAGGAFGSSNFKDSGSKRKNPLNTYWLAAGFSFKLGDKVTFDMLAGYNKVTVKYQPELTDSYKTSQGTTSIKVGFTMLLGSERHEGS